MEELFKSLSENVSEECFDDIIGIVEEVISEILVGDYKEKGAGEDELSRYSIKKELQKHFAGKLRGIRKHAEKNNKIRGKEARELYNQGQEQQSKEKKANDALQATFKKVDQAKSDYEQARDETPLKSKLSQAWSDTIDKMHKADRKLDKERAKGDQIKDKKTELLTAAETDEAKRKKASKLMSHSGRDDGTNSSIKVRNILNTGKKNRQYDW